MGTFPSNTWRKIWAVEGPGRLREAFIRDERDDFAACRSCGIWESHMATPDRIDGLDATFHMLTDIFERPTAASS